MRLFSLARFFIGHLTLSLDTWGSDGSCMNYNEYISCDSFRIRLNWLPFQEYGIWRYTVPLAAVGEKSCVSHSIAEEIDGIHPEW